MTRKHYTMIAERLRRAHLTAEDREPMQALVIDLANGFAQDNPAFDRAKFYAAVGIPATCS